MIGPAWRTAVGQGDLGLAITGAGSWLAQALLAELAAESLLPSRLRIFGSHDRRILLAGQERPVEALADAAPLDHGAWLLLHFAFLGKERVAALGRDAFIRANHAILSDVLRIAEPASQLRLVFASSGAVYDQDRNLIEDPAVCPYGWCKVSNERAIVDWCRARTVPLVIARIFNIGGPFVNKHESYALSAFILAARRRSVIRIAAQRPVFRSYVHVAELNGVLCEAALRQTQGDILRFDTAGRETVEMADLAEMVAVALRPAAVGIERSGSAAGGEDWYVGDGRIYRSMLARWGRPVTGLEQIVADTIRFLPGS